MRFKFLHFLMGSMLLGFIIVVSSFNMEMEEKQKEASKTTSPIPAISATEQSKIMEIIKNLSPSLYEAMIKVDPTGADHIKRREEKYKPSARLNLVGVLPSAKDGLPVVYIESRVIQIPEKQLRFIIAHELGHYALQHPLESPILTHRVLRKLGAIEFKKGKKISSQLPFTETFEFAFSREKEFEADRFAIIELDIPIDDAIAAAKEWIAESEELKKHETPTFKSTHPLSTARIDQFENLRREVELNKIHGRKPIDINWKKLAAYYLAIFRATGWRI
jgi:Zn-dependent protease with chaperone function